MSQFERDLREEMMKNIRGKLAEKPAPCPYCEREFHWPMEAVVFGGEINCSHCGQTFEAKSDVADSMTSDLEDFRRGLS